MPALCGTMPYPYGNCRKKGHVPLRSARNIRAKPWELQAWESWQMEPRQGGWRMRAIRNASFIRRIRCGEVTMSGVFGKEQLAQMVQRGLSFGVDARRESGGGCYHCSGKSRKSVTRQLLVDMRGNAAEDEAPKKKRCDLMRSP